MSLGSEGKAIKGEPKPEKHNLASCVSYRAIRCFTLYVSAGGNSARAVAPRVRCDKDNAVSASHVTETSRCPASTVTACAAGSMGKSSLSGSSLSRLWEWRRHVDPPSSVQEEGSRCVSTRPVLREEATGMGRERRSVAG